MNKNNPGGDAEMLAEFRLMLRLLLEMLKAGRTADAIRIIEEELNK